MKLKSFACLLILCLVKITHAQNKWELLEVDKGSILKTINVDFNKAEPKLIVVTSNNAKQGIKFSPYYVILKDNKIVSKTLIELSSLTDKAEETFDYFGKLNNGNVLMVSSPDKKVKPLVARVLSKDGKLIAEKVIAQNVINNSLLIAVKENDPLIRITYFDKEKKKQTFLFLTEQLEVNLSSDVEIEFKSSEKYLFTAVHYRDNFAYGINFNFLKKQKQVGKVNQLTFFKIDLKAGKLLRTASVASPLHLMSPRSFLRGNTMEVFVLCTAMYDKALGATMGVCQLDLNSFTTNFKNLNYRLEVYSTREQNDVAYMKMSIMDSIHLHLLKPRKADKQLSSAAKFHFDYNAKDSIYFVTYRLGIESTSTSYSDKGSRTYYNSTLFSGRVFKFNPSTNQLSFMESIDNFMLDGGNLSSHLFLLNASTNNFTIRNFESSSNHAIFTSVPIIENTIRFRLMENGHFTSKELVANVWSKATFFYPGTVKEIGENLFLCEVYMRGSGDRLLLFNFNP